MIHRRLLAGVLGAALLSGACDAGPAPTAVQTPTAPSASPAPSAPSPAPTVTPAPTPVDTAAAFVRIVTDPGFAATAALEGETRVGSTRTTTTGTLTISGRASRYSATSTTGKTRRTSDVIVVNDVRYAATDGLWFSTGAPGDANLGGVFAGMSAGVTDLGVEATQRRNLHHLRATPPPTLAASMGLAAKTVSDVAPTVDVWTEEDGTPVFATLAATYTVAVDKQPSPAAKTLDLVFSDVGSSAPIEAPTPVWQWNISSRYHYRLAYPTDWQFQQGTSSYADAYYGPAGEAVFASRAKSNGFTLAELSRGIGRYLPEITKLKGIRLIGNHGARLGSLPARRIEFRYAVGSKRYWSVLYLAVRGAWFYVVSLDTTHATTAADRALAALFARSFSAR